MCLFYVIGEIHFLKGPDKGCSSIGRKVRKERIRKKSSSSWNDFNQRHLDWQKGTLNIGLHSALVSKPQASGEKIIGPEAGVGTCLTTARPTDSGFKKLIFALTC